MKVTESVFWYIKGLKDADMTLQDISKKAKLSIRAITSNLSRGPPSSRRRKQSKKANPNLTKRRALVRTLLTKRVMREEQFEPTLNKDGKERKNSRQPRVQTRHPTGSLTRCRRALWNDHGIEVSRSTVRRDRQAVGLSCKRRPKGPERYKGDEERRLKFVTEKLPFARKNASNTLFVDEKLFDSLDCDRFAYVKPGEFAPPREVERFTPRVHVFGMIGVGFRFLHVFDDDEKVDSDAYRKKCLSPNLHIMRKKYFVHDGAGPHKGVKEWLAAQTTLGIVDFPPRSPDVNPIERIWSLVQQRVSAYGPLTKEQIREYVVQCWNEIPQSTIDKVVKSWPRMMEAVKEKKGMTSCKNLPKQALK